MAAAESPDKGGTIIWAVHEGMPSFDIHYEGSYIAAQPIGPLYNGLLTFDVYNNEQIVGDLAERWEVAPDGKRITFALRQGVKFHDGTDFTCADAKYSLDKLTDPKRANRAFVAIMEEVFEAATCTDDVTLAMTLKQPSAALLTMLAGAHAVMMKAGIAERLDRKDPKFLVGTGRKSSRHSDLPCWPLIASIRLNSSSSFDFNQRSQIMRKVSGGISLSSALLHPWA